MFKYKESFKHRFAKKLLIRWLRDQDETQDGCRLGNIYWRSNYGVHEELPFYDTSDPYYFEMSKGLKPDMEMERKYNHKELFDPNFNRGTLLFVPDITIFHKGTCIYLIEVVHKSPPSEKKLNKIKWFFEFHQNSINVLTISADHILGQIEKPTTLNFNTVLSVY